MSTTCGHCGLALDADDAFCGNCGEPANVQPIASYVTTVQPAPVQPAPVQPFGDATARPAPPRDAIQVNVAEAEVTGVEGYLQTVLRRQRVSSVTGEPTFDPLRNKRYLTQLLRRMLIYALVGVTVELVVLFFGVILAFIAGFAGLAVLPVVSFLVGIVLLLCFWLMPVPAMLAYGSQIVAYEAANAQRAFECIAEALRRHETPNDSFRERDLSLPSEGHRRYLEFRRGAFAGYVCCFPNGQDLYMSWTFWIYMSPLRCVLMRLGRMIQNLGGHGNDMYQTLRFESIRATVGAMQICSREGIEVALSEAAGEPYSLPDGPSVPIS